MTAMPNEEEILTLIERAERIVALTGAGLSTAAGIPDFRGPQGLYVTRRYDPEKVFDIRGFRRDPSCFYQFAADFADLLARVRPTFTHIFLARLEREGRLSAVITQNIDMLHQRAGSRNVIELHGAFDAATCCDCGRHLEGLDVSWWRSAIAAQPDNGVPRCAACDGVLKPDIVFFGEMVDHYAAAERVVRDCDVLLVLGTTLAVAPAAYLPEVTAAPVIAVARGNVELFPAAHRYAIDADLDDFCRCVAERLKG